MPRDIGGLNCSPSSGEIRVKEKQLYSFQFILLFLFFISLFGLFAIWHNLTLCNGIGNQTALYEYLLPN